MKSSLDDVKALLARISNGEEDAIAQLVSLVYGELRRIAAKLMRDERSNHTLRPTALVHEAYIKLVQNPEIDLQDKAHFMAVASRSMRQVLIDHARKHGRRPEGQQEFSLDENPLFSLEKAKEFLAVHDALERFAKINERAAQVVEMRYFGGMTIEVIAAALQVSEKTVKRDWTFAKAWFTKVLTPAKKQS